MDSNTVRKTFFDFFASKGHRIVPSAPMVIKDDPTLMFTNAGMNQFKDYILGHATPVSQRVCDSQKCLRVSGKQNDLEEVGHDTYHHTMFEMLGNWSFGDYFKREAIAWGWELLVDVYGIDPERLYVTVFEGDAKENVPEDTEAREHWLQYVPAERVLYGNKKDNFWEMGDTGPCGPCSEIHIDLRTAAERASVPGAELVNMDHPRVIEIWNLVFMQYNRLADGSLEPLPANVVDTGMGLERLCMVLQAKESNYDTDIFQDIIAHVAGMSGQTYGHDERVDTALRVVSDHVRAVAFSIADGQLPSNNRAGYVIRRILRRALRYGYSFLSFREPFLCRMVPVLVRKMGENYPELRRQEDLIAKVIFEEENAFLRTLEQGIQLLGAEVEKARAAGRKALDGQTAFTLYDTFGFPLDLTELMLREEGLGVDQAGFDACMEEQKDRSRSAGQISQGDWVMVGQEVQTEFVGYDHLEADVRIVKMRSVEKKGKRMYHVVLDRSPFYAEGGGQVGDRGAITSANERIEVLDVVKENNLPLLVVSRLPERPEVEFRAMVDAAARSGAACHHTASHLLHYALREVLGGHVEQKGSLVESDRLRFDFSHFQRMTDDELRRVEERVNSMVREALARDEQRDVPMAEALAAGATALFGEKYGDRVRLVRFGSSVELCGGTHVANTGAIGLFRIVSESAISAGVRRIEAVAGRAAELRDYAMDDSLRQLDGMLHSQGKPVEALQRLQEELAAQRRKLEHFRMAWVGSTAAALLEGAVEVPGVRVVSKHLGSMPPEDVKDVAMALRAKGDNIAVVLGAVHDGKPGLAVAFSDALVKSRGLNAGKIVRAAAVRIQGGGGGQAFFAAAGGRDADGVESALAEAVGAIGKA
ncbi:MAG: alanine--tRNA ligase [Bacteroidia bacterium]|nr:MAG: alanine--tRNA ligase [Bacteroidia bacterium]